MQAHSEHTGRNEIPGSRELLTANHVIVMHSGQVDGGPLSTVNLVDVALVVLQ
jgi:hypothetical protein